MPAALVLACSAPDVACSPVLLFSFDPSAFLLLRANPSRVKAATLSRRPQFSTQAEPWARARGKRSWTRPSALLSASPPSPRHSHHLQHLAPRHTTLYLHAQRHQTATPKTSPAPCPPPPFAVSLVSGLSPSPASRALIDCTHPISLAFDSSCRYPLTSCSPARIRPNAAVIQSHIVAPPCRGLTPAFHCV